MTNNPENPMAFPRIAHGQDSGMTLRDYFAGKALSGLLASPHSNFTANPEEFAASAHLLADAMLKQRIKGE